jgi:hypothetical protein
MGFKGSKSQKVGGEKYTKSAELETKGNDWVKRPKVLKVPQPWEPWNMRAFMTSLTLSTL